MTDPLIGRVLAGRYRLDAPLGRGGMGVVYAGVQLDMGRPVAVKVLAGDATNEDLERFGAEALAAASLAHPHIVQVSDAVSATGADPPFLVMELLRGSSLATLLGRDGPMPPDVAVHIVVQVLDALSAAHDARILHRDIKPGNIFVLDGADRRRPWVKLIDFGIAKIADFPGAHTQTGVVIGTASYMAPEVQAGVRASIESDLFAVGACAYEMLTGQKAAQGRALLASMTPVLADVVRRALDDDPRNRFHDASEMRRALRESVPDVTVTGPITSKSPWPLFVVPLLVTLLAGVAVVVFLLARRDVATAPADAAPPSTSVAVRSPDPPAPTTSSSAEPAVSTSVSSKPPPAPSANGARQLCMCGSVFADGVRAEFYCMYPVVYQCECVEADGFPLNPNPATTTALRVQRDLDASGEACLGFHNHSPDPSTRSKGTLRCLLDCTNNRQEQSAREAVPGTRCQGWLSHAEPSNGTWMPMRKK